MNLRNVKIEPGDILVYFWDEYFGNGSVPMLRMFLCVNKTDLICLYAHVKNKSAAKWHQGTKITIVELANINDGIIHKYTVI